MIVFFSLILLIRSEIPLHLKDLANRAISNSKIKTSTDKRVDTAYPSHYSFPNVDFMLKRILSAPTTNDIKGFAIENENIAIVKRKKFNLSENFVFVDPSEQKLYDMKKLIASDETVNIYSTKNLTIFDIMTNFNYQAKTSKEFSPQVNLNWDTEADQPKLHNVPKIGGVKFGLGAYGRFTVDTYFRFKSAADICIGANIRVSIKAAAQVHLSSGDAASTGSIRLFTVPKIPLVGLGVSFSFLGIGFAIQPYIKCDASIDELRVKVPASVDYTKGYHVVGAKNIEISPYAVTDTKWDIHVYNMPERNSLEEIGDMLAQAEFTVTPSLRFYLSIELQFLGIESVLDVGLRVPFRFTFTFDKERCLMPYLYGDIGIVFNMFYEFTGIQVTYRSATNKFREKSRQLLKVSSGEVAVFAMNTGKFCIVEPSKAVEGSSAVLQQGNARSYFVENGDFFWKSGRIDPAQLVIEARDASGALITLRSLPYESYSASQASPTRVSSHFIVTTDKPPRINWHFNGYVTYEKVEKKKILFFFEHTYRYWVTEFRQSELHTFDVGDDFQKISQEVAPAMRHEGNVLAGRSTVWNCRDVSANKVFTREQDAMVITRIRCNGRKAALIALSKSGDTRIDETAVFYAETMLSEAFSERAVFSASPHHYEFNYFEFEIAEPMQLEINATLETTQNGAKVAQHFAGFSTYFNSEKRIYSSAEVGLARQNIKFYALAEHAPVVTFDIKFSVFKQNGDVATSTHKRSFNYAQIESSAGQQQVEMNFADTNTKVKVRVTKIESPLVSIKSSTPPTDDNVIAPVFDQALGSVRGGFTLSLEEDEVYFAVRFTSSCGVPIGGNYIVLKSDAITPLVKDVVRISNDVFCIRCESGSAAKSVPFRRISGEKQDLTVEYLMTDLNDAADANMDTSGEVVSFTSPLHPKAFVVPTVLGESDIFYTTKSPLSFHSLKVDDYSELVAVINENASPEDVTFVTAHAYIADGQYMVSYDTSHIERLLEGTDIANFSVKVICASQSVRAIRCGSSVVPLVGNVATFTFEAGGAGLAEFFSVCRSGEDRMCEITDISSSGEFQLLRFPTRDGLNITGRGMKSAIIHAPQATSFSYYKTFEGAVDKVRSYGAKTKVVVAVRDVFVKKKKKAAEAGEAEDEPTSYREFCIRDADGNILPFSASYISESFDEFMASVGAAEDYDVTQYGISESDCVTVDHDAIKENTFLDLPRGIVDLQAEDERIAFDTKGVKFDPKRNPGKTAAIVVGAFLAAAVIAIAVFIVIDMVKKKKQRESSVQEQSNQPPLDFDDI